MLTMAKKSCSGEDSSNAVRQTENSNHQGNDGRVNLFIICASLGY
jgi:hypothetical protein